MKTQSIVAMCFVFVCACEQPNWPADEGRHSLKANTFLCETVVTNEHNLLVTAVSIKTPIKRMTSLMLNAAWFTPVEWRVDEVLYSAATPGKTLNPIRSATFVLYMPQAWSEIGRQRTIGIHDLDGEWMLTTRSDEQYTLTNEGWRREGASYSWPTETFSDAAAMKAAFISKAVECPREDWLTPTAAGIAEVRRARAPGYVAPPIDPKYLKDSGM
jgi:hypothetical protein